MVESLVKGWRGFKGRKNRLEFVAIRRSLGQKRSCFEPVSHLSARSATRSTRQPTQGTFRLVGEISSMSCLPKLRTKAFVVVAAAVVGV